MGFTPAMIDQMSPWEYNAVVDGWIAANQVDEKPGGELQVPSDFTVNDLRAFMAKPGP